MILLFLIAILLLVTAGFGVASALSPKRAWDPGELLGYSVVFGFASVTAIWWALSFAFSHSALLWCVAACCAALGVLGWKRFGTLDAKWNWRWICVFAPFWGLVIWQTIVHPIEGDGLFIWDFKARMAFEAAGRIPSSYFSAPDTLWSHPTYPLAVPLFETWIYTWTGKYDQRVAPFGFLIFLAAVQGLLWSIVRRRTGRPSQGHVAALLVFFVPWLMLKPGGAISNWADFPLAAAYLAGLACLLETKPDASLARFTFAAAVLPWIKQEGAILALALLVVLFLQKELAPRRKALCAGIILLAAAPWKLFLTLSHAAPNPDYFAVGLKPFLQNAPRVPVIATRLAIELVKFPFWGMLWPTALVSLWGLHRASKENQHAARTLLICISLPITLLCSAYIFSAWPNYLNHINTSLTRVLIPPAMPALVAVGLWLPANLFMGKPRD